MRSNWQFVGYHSAQNISRKLLPSAWEGAVQTPTWPRPVLAPPLSAARASSFRVALGRARRGLAAAREPGSRPRAPAFPRRLVAGEATARASPGPYRVRPFLSFSLLGVSVFFRRWGWAGPGRSRSLGSRDSRQRSQLLLPALPPPACVCWACLGPCKHLTCRRRRFSARLPARREASPNAGGAGLFTLRGWQVALTLQPRVGHAPACVLVAPARATLISLWHPMVFA